MKSNFTFILMWLLCVFSLNTRAQTQFWSDTFESNPSSGIRTPQGTGGTGTPATSYFKLTDGSNVSQVVAFSGKEGGNYWAGEDHNATGTGLPSAGAGTDDPLNELQINWTGINIAGKSGLSFKGLIAANSTSQAWDNKQACLSGVGTTNTDYIIVEYQIDGGAWTNLVRFYNKGSASGPGLTWKNLYEDTDNNGCGDGVMLNDSFGEFEKTIAGTGSTMSLRIRVYSEGNNEEWGIDNFRLYETPACSIVLTPASQTNVSCFGGSNGAASVNTPTGGAGGYTYNWTPGNPTGDGTASVSGLTAGTWTCTVTDANSCTASVNFTVTQPIALVANATAKTNVSCNGGSDGSATVSATGGAGAYTYLWAPSGGTAATATGLAAGTYTVTVTDSNGCTATQSFSITEPTALVTNADAQTNVSCNGGSNGSATVSVTGGTAAYTYSWSPAGGTAATASGLAAGTYTVTVTDANLCQTTQSFIITEPATLVANPAAQTNVSCNGGTNGSASVSVTGGTGAYTYSWSPAGGTAATATGLAAGTYTVTATDANLCQTTQSFTITQPATLVATPAAQTNVSCNGGSNGSATVNVSGGTAGYTYSWAPAGGTAATATGLAAGTYTVTVTDANGCTATQSFSITQPTALVANAAAQTNVSCNGGSNGSASVSATGGTGAYTYSWSPAGGTAATATGLAAGTYTVTVTDASGCTENQFFTITQPLAIAVAVTGNEICENSTATLTANGADGYNWYDVPSGGLPLASGSTFKTPILTEDTDFYIEGVSYSPNTPLGTTFSGGNNHRGNMFNVTSVSNQVISSFDISPMGDNYPIEVYYRVGGYEGFENNPSGWTLLGTTTTGAYTGWPVNITVGDLPLQAGQTYGIYVTSTDISKSLNYSNGSGSDSHTDGVLTIVTGVGLEYPFTAGTGAVYSPRIWNGRIHYKTVSCTGPRETINMTVNPLPVLNITTTNVSCNGVSDGEATVTATGTGPFDYSWNTTPVQTTATATGLSPGSYTVTVTNTKGCMATQNFTITEPAPLVATAAAQTEVSCNGGTNGSASVSVTGGTGAYTYSWSPAGGTAPMASGLAAGTYTVTVTDANLCQTTQSFTITEPATLVANTATQTNVSCNGGSNGSATVNVSGGIPGYTYLWAPSGGTAATATGLAAGTYTVTATDANGCTATQSFSITQPTALVANAAAQTNVSCNGGSIGSASVCATGGTVAYTYSWSPAGGTAATASGLAAGTYTVTVTDANLCQTTQSFTITEPTTLVANPAAQTNVSCNGGTNGSASVSVTGGTGAYTYSWSPAGGTAATASGLAAGTYTVTVTDANGCMATRSFTITQPTALVANAASQTNVSCNGGSNGSATVNVSGGTAGYTYSWSPSGGTAATANGLAPGTYTATATDANGCTVTQSFTITQPSALSLTTTTLSGYDYNALYSQTITATGGTGVKSYAVTSGSLPSGFTLSSSGAITGTSTQVADSNFTVTVTDANSCTATYDFTLKLNQIPITVTATASQVKVYGQSDPVLAYTVTPSLLPGDSFTGALTRVAGENIGNYAINAGTLSAGPKYLMTFVGKDFSITAKSIVVTAAAKNKTYGDADPALTYTFAPSLVTGDSFSGSLTRSPGENVGTYSINQGTLDLNSNYNLTYIGADLTIGTKPITVTAAAKNKTYGDADPALTYTFAPALVTGDSFSGSLTRSPGENVGTYAINQGTLALNSNYTLTYVGTDLTIGAKTVTVTAAAKSKTYGDADPALTYTFAPALKTGDSFTGSLNRLPGENVGTYAINQGTLALSSNYTLTYVGADLTIGAKTVTVTAAAKSKTYGDADPALTYTFAPALVTGDSFSGSLTRSPGENVGTYAINQGTLALNSNYNLTYIGADLTIGAKTITVTAAAKNKIYGDADPALTYTFAPALVTGDAFSGGLSRTVGENAGTYAINQGTLTLNANYTLVYVGADLTILKANQTITWNQSLGYGCEGETTVVLTATSNSGLPVSYTSSNSNLVSVSGNSLNLLNYGSATITASQTGNNNYNPAVVVALPLVNSQPNLIRKQFDDVIFFDNSSRSFKSYSWYKNGVLLPSQTTQYFKESGTLNGTYHAVATKLDGTLITTCPLVLAPTVEEEHIKIVPNPAKPNASYELVTNVSSSRLQNARVEVYNVGGLLIESKTTSENRVILTAPMAEGIYIVKMTLANGKYFTKNLLVKN